MDVNRRVWSSVGSAGAVDVRDLAKVEFRGSIVRLHGSDPEVSELAAVEPMTAGAPGVTTTEAVIRYQVAPNVFEAGQSYALRAFCRRGRGKIVVKLILVSRPPLNTPTSVSELAIVSFESQNPNPLSFVMEQPLDTFQTVLVNETAYVEVTLTGRSGGATLMINPPEMALVEAVTALP